MAVPDVCMLIVRIAGCVAKDDVVLDCLLVTELDSAAELSQFVLRNRGHDRQTQLGIFVQSIDVSDILQVSGKDVGYGTIVHEYQTQTGLTTISYSIDADGVYRVVQILKGEKE